MQLSEVTALLNIVLKLAGLYGLQKHLKSRLKNNQLIVSLKQEIVSQT